ncbi:MAG: outer membrane protein assembly factor BamD [bacterium]|nr:outer membrane protein assembly factor BamD [bacterium]
MKATLIIPVIALLFCGCAVELPDLFSLTAQEWFDLGKGYYDKEEMEAARGCFENVMIVYPSSKYADDSQFYLGMAYYDEDMYLEAQAIFEDMAASYPNSSYTDDAHYHIGQCYFKRAPDYQRDTELIKAAIGEYRRTLKLFPGSELIPQIQDAIREAEELEARKLDHIAYLYRRMEHPRSVILYADMLLGTYPDSMYAPRNLWRRGEALLELGYPDDARNDFERILEEYPDDEYAADARESLNTMGSLPGNPDGE